MGRCMPSKTFKLPGVGTTVTQAFVLEASTGKRSSLLAYCCHAVKYTASCGYSVSTASILLLVISGT